LKEITAGAILVSMVRVLHTSDWHLGAQLYEKDRLEEQRLFLRWLAGTIEQEKVRVLVVSGDIFDTHAPSVQAQTLYYEFLAGLQELGGLGRPGPEIFIIAGNHDSPLFLNASRDILSRLKIHIVSGLSGTGGEDASPVYPILDENDNPVLAVCAVPFLREKDFRLIGDLAADLEDPGANSAEAKYREAAAAHYHRVVVQAGEQMPNVPVLVTGHLFLSGSELSDTTSERLREVGRLSGFPVSLLPPADYYALGHLHRPQCVNGNEQIRYSGAPIAMSFAEAEQAKSVALVEFESNSQPSGGQQKRPIRLDFRPKIRLLEIPQFLSLRCIRGDAEYIRGQLAEIKAAGKEVCVDIQVTSCAGSIHDFWDEINAFKAEALEARAPFAVLAVRDVRNTENAGMPEIVTEIASLQPIDVFLKKLDAESIEGEERETFTALFKEIEQQVRSGETLTGADC